MNEQQTEKEPLRETAVSGCFSKEQATHRLHCIHALGKNRKSYYMDCLILKRMKDGRLKVLVFGDRYWKRNTDKQTIRYVEPFKVSPK